MNNIGPSAGGRKVVPELGVSPDYINAWMLLGNIAVDWQKYEEIPDILDGKNRPQNPYEKTHEIFWLSLVNDQKVLTYEKYLAEQNNTVALKDSDILKVSLINNLVEFWNENSDKIINEKRFDLISWFFNSVDKLVRG